MDKRRRGDTKDHPLAQWFTNFSEADELLKLAAARQQVSMIAFMFCPYSSVNLTPLRVICFCDLND
jgi:hypothetical protein